MASLLTPRLLAASISSADGTNWKLVTSPNTRLGGFVYKVVSLSAYSEDNVDRYLQIGSVRVSRITITIASPGVFSWPGHNFTNGEKIWFTTTGLLPTGLTSGTLYYAVNADMQAGTFRVAATPGGPAINISGTQSGTHTGYVVRVRNTVLVPALAGNLGFEAANMLPSGILPSDNGQPCMFFEVGDYLAFRSLSALSANVLISVHGEAYSNDTAIGGSSAYAGIIG